MTDRDLQQGKKKNLVHGGKDLMHGREALLTQSSKGCPPVVLAWDEKVFQEAVASVSRVCVRAMLRFSRAKRSLEVTAQLPWFWCITASIEFFS